jgi:cytoskeletal protein CcmA (bactofilin family)
MPRLSGDARGRVALAPESLTVSPRPLQPARFGEHVTVRGVIFAEQDLVLAGGVDGDLNLPNHAVTIDRSGRVSGSVFARIIIILGRVTGEITASERIEIMPEATVEASLTAPRLALHEGAFYRGKVEMKRAEAAVRVARYRLEKQVPAAEPRADVRPDTQRENYSGR